MGTRTPSPGTHAGSVGGDCETPVKAVRAVTRSQKCEPGWTPKEMAARQDADPDNGPIMRWKRAGNNRPRWEDISPESRETKVLWRQWERLYLVRGVLHRQFHKLKGHGWRPQLVVPADRRGSLLQRFHGGMIGGFYWPGMRADVSRICNECDCAMLKRRRGRQEPLHQYIVGVPMERLAMDVAGPYPVTSAGKQYCLMVGCYFSNWLECFPIPDQKATTVARKLVFEIVARYGAFRELHSDQGTNFGSKVVLEVCRLFGIHKTRTTPYHPRSDEFIEWSFRTLGWCLKAACRETKQEWDELVPLILMSYRASKHGSDPQHDDKVLDRGRVVVRRKRDKPLAVMHVDRLKMYRGTAVLAWMTTEQREYVAV